MNINKWRVVRHESLFRKLPYPWHVYPPGVPILENPTSDLEYVNLLTRGYDGETVSIHETHFEAVDVAHSCATIDAKNAIIRARKAATTL